MPLGSSVGGGVGYKGAGSAVHHIRCVDSFKVGVEQQLHHFEMRALGGGVVQGQLLALCTRRVAQYIWCCRAVARARNREGKGTWICRGSVGGAVWAGLRALSFVLAASELASRSNSVTSSDTPLATA